MFKEILITIITAVSLIGIFLIHSFLGGGKRIKQVTEELNVPDVEYVITPQDIEWEMPWGDKHPEKPAKEWIFEVKGALAHLLLNEVVLVNTHWYRDDWSDDAKATTAIAVICNDVFILASGDAQSIGIYEIETLYRLWTAETRWGSAAWCVFKAKQPPHSRVRKKMEQAGWDIDWLLSTTKQEILDKYRRGPTVVSL